MSAIEVLGIAASARVGLLFVTLTALSLVDEGRRARALRRLRGRTRRAETAAFEASLDAPEFDPDAIRWRSSIATATTRIALSRPCRRTS